ncbi:hypothetical protein [Cytobacillus horneckiae]|uniref:hypothetical protein n=1 Tax=Cytobacillus horneckiae TaxID=549687 RepID=UPI003D9AAC7F
MESFPIIHTNFWDAVIAVPLVVILTQLCKIFFQIPKHFISVIANIFGLIISIFFAHSGHIWAGIFMGFFYGNAAVGLYSSLKTQLQKYRSEDG